LVAKASVWYVVGMRAGQLRAWRVARIKSVLTRQETFQRPANFDLADFWKTWCQQVETNRPDYRVWARVSPTLARILKENWPETLQQAPTQTRDGWQELELNFESLEAARTRILGYGGAIEVLEPHSLRLSLIDYANQVLACYAHA